MTVAKDLPRPGQVFAEFLKLFIALLTAYNVDTCQKNNVRALNCFKKLM